MPGAPRRPGRLPRGRAPWGEGRWRGREVLRATGHEQIDRFPGLGYGGGRVARADQDLRQMPKRVAESGAVVTTARRALVQLVVFGTVYRRSPAKGLAESWHRRDRRRRTVAVGVWVSGRSRPGARGIGPAAWCAASGGGPEPWGGRRVRAGGGQPWWGQAAAVLVSQRRASRRGLSRWRI